MIYLYGQKKWEDCLINIGANNVLIKTKLKERMQKGRADLKKQSWTCCSSVKLCQLFRFQPYKVFRRLRLQKWQVHGRREFAKLFSWTVPSAARRCANKLSPSRRWSWLITKWIRTDRWVADTKDSRMPRYSDTQILGCWDSQMLR